MSFSSPKQLQAVELDDFNSLIQDCGSGWMLLFHPDFIYGHALGTSIKSYGYFSYQSNEALNLAEKEEQTLAEIFTKIESEYQFIDAHTQNIILTQIELLLQYCDRFYQRRFIALKKASNA